MWIRYVACPLIDYIFQIWGIDLFGFNILLELQFKSSKIMDFCGHKTDQSNQ